MRFETKSSSYKCMMHLRMIPCWCSTTLVNAVAAPLVNSFSTALLPISNTCSETSSEIEISVPHDFGPQLEDGHFGRVHQLFDETSKSGLGYNVSSLHSSSQEFESGMVAAAGFYSHLLKYLLKEGYSSGSHQLLAKMSDQRLAMTLLETKVIHAQVLKIGVPLDKDLGNSLVDLYAKCGSLNLAENLFKRLGKRDEHAWNSILSAHCRRETDECIRLFGAMWSSSARPNQFTFAIVLSACGRLVDHGFGQMLHCGIIKMGYELSSFCQGSLIDMYAKCNLIDDARKVFDRSVDPDMVSWTAMISGYVRIGSYEEASRLFSKMDALGKTPDQVLLVTAINSLLKTGKLQEARDLFNQMQNPNVVAWNVMISGHAQNGHADEALRLFKDMQRRGFKPTRSTMGSVLSAVCSSAASHNGRLIHSFGIKVGLDANIYSTSSLISMYSKCDAVDDARKVFDISEDKNLVVWNSMLSGYMQNEFSIEVLDLFVKMQGCEVLPDECTYVSALCACSQLETTCVGQQLHSNLLKRSYGNNIYVQNALVDMYGKSGDMKDAWRQFELIEDRDVISWNAIIGGYAYNNEEENAILLLNLMRFAKFEPDDVSLSNVLSACADLQTIEMGEQIHCLSIKLGYESNLYVGSSIIDMYVKCNALLAANNAYKNMPVKNVVSRNAFLSGLARNNNSEGAVGLFRDLQVEGLKPTEFTFASILPVFGGQFGLDMGKQVHGYTIKSGLLRKDLCLVVALLGMYLKLSNKEEAKRLLCDNMHLYTSHTILWTAMISGCVENNDLEEALQLFWEMRCKGITSDEATFASILSACAKLTSLRNGKEVHSLILKAGYDSDVCMSSTLIDMYSKCGQLEDSWQVFNEVNDTEEIIPWNSIIVGFATNGFAEDALHIFSEMQMKHIQPDGITYLGALTACSHRGLVSKGLEFFETMKLKNGIQPRPDHYACMIDLLGREGSLEQAELFIKSLPFEPDSVIWATFLSACRIHGDTERGKWAAEELIKLEPHNSSPYVLLSNLYAASGDWNKFNEVRREMRNRGVHKSPGCSWIEVNRKNNVFVAGDKFHPMANDIYAVLNELMCQIYDGGYVAKQDLFSMDEIL